MVTPEHNPGPAAPARAGGFDPDWIRAARVDEADVHRPIDDLRAAPIPSAERRPRLLRAIRCMDLTSLTGDESRDAILALAARARDPLGDPGAATTAGVCVFPAFVPIALEALEGSGVAVATVAGDFPAGLAPFPTRLEDVRTAAESGAAEVDVVIDRRLVVREDWRALHEEVRAFRDVCGDLVLKVILATGDLPDLTRVARASRACLAAGADFLKTSTGREAVNATLAAGMVMAGAIRDHHERTGVAAGLKPAGGIRTAGQALEWLALVDRELGDAWVGPARFRIGASSLLDDLLRSLRTRDDDE